MGVRMAIVTSYGPALLICLTVVIGIVYNSSRVTDLRSYMDARFNAVDKRIDDSQHETNRRLDDMNKRIDDLKHDMNQRLEDLKDFLKSEVKRLEDRMSPIHRG